MLKITILKYVKCNQVENKSKYKYNSVILDPKYKNTTTATPGTSKATATPQPQPCTTTGKQETSYFSVCFVILENRYIKIYALSLKN